MTNETHKVAASTIAFLARLHGMHEHHIDGHDAVIDLLSGIAYVPNADYDDGVMLAMIAPGGGLISPSVVTHKVVETYLVRHAQAMAIIDGGNAKGQYEQIQEHFDVKTSV